MNSHNDTKINRTRAANKKFGQNYLVNPSMQLKVIKHFEELIDEYQDKKVLEIGPGEGDLSQHLLKYEDRFVMIEIDESKVKALQSSYMIGQTKLIQGDAYKDIKDLQALVGGDFILVSNLPFNVGSRILVDLALYYPQTPFGVILQKEVAKKTSLDSDLTFFGAWLRLFWDLKVVFDIGKGNFVPAPKVVSSYLQGIPNGNDWSFEKRLKAKELLKSLFAMPNKTVWNNLKNIGWSSQELEKVWMTEGFKPNLRLSWQNYNMVLRKLLKY